MFLFSFNMKYIPLFFKFFLYRLTFSNKSNFYFFNFL